MTPDRRALLRASVGATAALVASTDSGRNEEETGSPDRAHLEGMLSCEREACAAAAQDFGAIISRQPSAVFRPGSAADIAGLLRWAGSHGLRVAARGQGHSVYGRAQAENGVVIWMDALNSIHGVEADRVVVGAGATWKSVLEATLARGLTPPVLTNYLGLSIGGTIAVGGIGGSTSRHGMQTDHVIELEVVTGEGSVVTCSAGSGTKLFDAVRGGLAQCGVITRAALRLVRAPRRVRRYQFFYPNLASLVVDQQGALADNRFSQLQGAVIPDAGGGWRYQLEGAVFHDGGIPDEAAVLGALSDRRKEAVISDSSYLDDALAFEKLEAVLKSHRAWFNPQPWLFTFLRASNAEQVVADVLARLDPKTLGPFGRITFYPIRTGAIRTPLVRLPREEVVFVFNVVRIGASQDVETTQPLIEQNRAIYDQVRAAGGSLYPVSAFPMSHEDWRDHFGEAWAPLHEARLHHDPHGLLTPGYALS